MLLLHENVFNTTINKWENINEIKRTLNPLATNVPNHTETNKFVWIANQLTGFYMIGNTGH